MTTATLELAATSTEVLRWIAALAGGIFIAGALVWAVQFGMRVRDKESPRPTPEEQTHLPDGGAVHEIREVREPDEVPHGEGGERLLPHELHAASSRRSEDQHRKRWDPGHSGSFGGGGIGHR
ncbi:DUF6479 family protein [Streptomyces nigra]|uniref:DUF6479 family protein n=1 Tax=Streptomyces nigra TaxID=1827580 RepID=A0ABZ1IWG4_9ACTN|nr:MULTISPECIES: DUF6479 family protein [unclassified Streptomyces]MBQ0998083.1 hypothetical protein [Streptomyces sp. RK62]